MPVLNGIAATENIRALKGLFQNTGSGYDSTLIVWRMQTVTKQA